MLSLATPPQAWLTKSELGRQAGRASWPTPDQRRTPPDPASPSSPTQPTSIPSEPTNRLKDLHRHPLALTSCAMKFLLVGSVSPLNEFRLPELDSIAALFGFEISYPGEVDTAVS